MRVTWPKRTVSKIPHPNTIWIAFIYLQGKTEYLFEEGNTQQRGIGGRMIYGGGIGWMIGAYHMWAVQALCPPVLFLICVNYECFKVSRSLLLIKSSIMEILIKPTLVLWMPRLQQVCFETSILADRLCSAGSGIGGGWGLFEGVRMISKDANASSKIKLNTVLNCITKRGPYAGNTSALLGNAFNQFDFWLSVWSFGEMFSLTPNVPIQECHTELSTA